MVKLLATQFLGQPYPWPKIMKNTFKIVLIAAIAAQVVVGCSSSEPKPDASATAPTAPTEVQKPASHMPADVAASVKAGGNR